MGRKPNESDASRLAFAILLFLGLLSCFLVYMGLSYNFRSSPISFEKSGTASSLSLGGGDNGRECCDGVENLELWGAAVKWGSEFRLNSSRECCRACKAMCGVDGLCLCDSWVFCGDREKCGPKFGECWLKKQNDPLVPDKKEFGENVVWTSGLIFGKAEGIIRLETEYGVLHIKLFSDCAPHSVAYILELLAARHCAGCHFYRAEGRGSSWDTEGNPISDAPLGPPYALIQGSLEVQGVAFNPIPNEASPPVRRGSVAWVNSGPEFFISLANHGEWKKAYTVFGSVLPDDMEIAEKIAQLPAKADVWSNIRVLVLEKPLHLRFRRITNARDSR